MFSSFAPPRSKVLREAILLRASTLFGVSHYEVKNEGYKNIIKKRFVSVLRSPFSILFLLLSYFSSILL